MKDAKGHGSDARGGGGDAITARLRRPDIGITNSANFSGRILNPNLVPTEGQRTVSDLRGRMQGSGPGHQQSLGQAIKNLLGE